MSSDYSIRRKLWEALTEEQQDYLAAHPDKDVVDYVVELLGSYEAANAALTGAAQFTANRSPADL